VTVRVRVLLADDEPEMRLLYRIGLEQDGRFDVVGEATDGTAAVRLAEELRPDAVLLDMVMPGMDGLEALPFVRRAVPDALVVLLSALPANAYAEQATALGASACVTKLGTGSPADVLAELLWGSDGRGPERPESRLPRA
jgi:DNA-binding NarL/FixJ family response regulator